MPKRSFFRGPEAFFLLFGGIWMLVGVPFFLAGLSLLAHQLHANRRFAAEGKVVPGMVVEKFTRRSGSNTRYAIRYRFTPAGGQEATAIADLDSDAWQELSENSTIPVTYLESDPRVRRVPGQDREMVLPLVFTPIGALFGGVGTVIFTIGVRKLRRRRRLER